MIRSSVQVTVRYAETDMMGIVYHANYLPWFEVGRTTLLKEIGVPYRKLEEEGFRLPVLEVSAKYLRPALYDDTLDVVTTLSERPLLRIRLDYEVRRGDELREELREPIRVPDDGEAKRRGRADGGRRADRVDVAVPARIETVVHRFIVAVDALGAVVGHAGDRRSGARAPDL